MNTEPWWVREMSDEDAYMALVLNNAQGELHPLEVGLHALKSGLTVRDYAKRIRMKEDTLYARTKAANVLDAVVDINDRKVTEYWQQLAAIHPAPEWAWSALVETLLEEAWTVEATRPPDKAPL